MTVAYNLSEHTQVLFTRSADTNQFIRQDSRAALEELAEHLSVARAFETLIECGVNHRNVVCREVLAR